MLKSQARTLCISRIAHHLVQLLGKRIEVRINGRSVTPDGRQLFISSPDLVGQGVGPGLARLEPVAQFGRLRLESLILGMQGIGKRAQRNHEGARYSVNGKTSAHQTFLNRLLAALAIFDKASTPM